MSKNNKPKRALLAYCALAERLNTPGVGLMQALTPFLADICGPFAGTMFDAKAFAEALNLHYDLKISRLASLGLAEQLAKEGLLQVVSGYAKSTVYQYSNLQPPATGNYESPVSEEDVVGFLKSFVDRCRNDSRFDAIENSYLEEALFDRLLNVDSMRLLSRREASIAAKKTATTLVLSKENVIIDSTDSKELHLDFLVSEFLLDLRDNNPVSFELASNVAFASMAAEAIACFREPTIAGDELKKLTVYLDAPLLLDMLGVNSEYVEYGKELLEAMKSAGVNAAVLDHSIDEAEAAVHAQLMHLRSGFNKMTSGWGVSATPALLTALVGNVGERSERRLGLSIHRDPEVNLHRNAPATVGDIEAEMNSRMQHWKNPDAKAYDRKSVWAMLKMRDTSNPCPRICDSRFLFLARNTSLVSIANNAWITWLKGIKKHSTNHIEKWAPVAMSDKQFAGYLWARAGGSSAAIPRARLIAHCSAAVRPRADIKTKAYNLVLALHGKAEADDIAALLEDREGGRALMQATLGDPEDVTHARLPFILERVKLAAGEYAAEKVREESEAHLDSVLVEHKIELTKLQSEQIEIAQRALDEANAIRLALLDQQQSNQDLERQRLALINSLQEQTEIEMRRKLKILKEALIVGINRYWITRWGVALVVGLLSFMIIFIASDQPLFAGFLTVALALGSFWFVPELLDLPLHRNAVEKMRKTISSKDSSIQMPKTSPDFKNKKWIVDLDGSNNIEILA